MYKHSIILIMFACILFCSKAFSVENESLSVTAKPHKNNLLIGEPLFISSSIKNDGKSPIELHYAGGPGYSVLEGLASVLISEDGEKYRGWRSGTQREIYKMRPIEFGPGQSWSSEFTVLYGSYGWDEKSRLVFLEEKPYFVCVEYLFRQQEGKDFLRIRSVPIRIDVTKPKGEDLSLWEKLQTDTRYAEIIQGADEITLQQDELDRLSDLCKKYPKTTYAPYLVLSLGRYYFTQFERWRNRKDYMKDAAENKEKALRYLEIIHSITENPTLWEKADIILRRLKPGDETIIRKKGTEIIIKGEGCLDEMISFIEEETGIEISEEMLWLKVIDDADGILKVEDMLLNKTSKYSFKVKVKKGDKEEMLNIAKSFLKEALTQLKLSNKISIKEKDGKIYLIPK